MAKPNGSAIFALKAWTIKHHNEKFYIAPTACFDDRTEWSKGYASLHAACQAVARQLAEEWRKRNERRSAFYGAKEKV